MMVWARDDVFQLHGPRGDDGIVVYIYNQCTVES